MTESGDNTTLGFEVAGEDRTDRDVQIFPPRPEEEFSLLPLRSTVFSGQITDANSC